MYQFVFWLKAIATILITNSHYANIWPVSAMAMGGHLGNCLFFLVAGFCMCRIRDSFPRWYAKRILRIYPALWLAIIFNILTGAFSIGSFSGFVHCFFYPTWYHFITSIMLLYLLFYLVRKVQEKTGIKTWHVILVSLMVFAVVYLFIFDKTYYHIDAVEEKWVRFQFWVSMMIGVWLKERYENINPTLIVHDWVLLFVSFVSCFGFKLALRSYSQLYLIQGLLPMLWVFLAYRIAVIFIKLEKMSALDTAKKWNQLAGFLASLTLEIYLVQNVIINRLDFLPFPVNFAVVTLLIIAVAWTVHQGAKWLQKKCSSLLFKG